MFYMGRRATRGRRGKSLILTGLVIFIIGLIITIGSYSFADNRGGGTYIVSWGPMIIGIISMVRGTAQVIADRRAGVSGPGQGIPQPGAGNPLPGYGVPGSGVPGSGVPGYGQGTGTPDYGQGAGAPEAAQPTTGERSYDQPGYGMPRPGDRPQG
jgi:hypothetical protein